MNRLFGTDGGRSTASEPQDTYRIDLTPGEVPTGWAAPTIGQIGPMRIQVHLPLLLFLMLMTSFSLCQHLWNQTLFFFVVLVSLLVHELAHAFVAVLLGYRIRSLVLYPLRSGLAFSRINNPVHEFGISMAGPAANLLLSAIATAALATAIGRQANTLVALLHAIALVNVMIALLNLIPAYPFDGGQALRATLSVFHARSETATSLTIIVSRLVALVFLSMALIHFKEVGLPWVLLMIVVFLGSKAAALPEPVDSAVRPIPARDAMTQNFRTLLPGQTVEGCIQPEAGGSFPQWQTHFPVVYGDEALGLVSREEWKQALEHGRGALFLSEVMSRRFTTVSEDESLDADFQRSLTAQRPVLVVNDLRRVVGMITLESLRDALREQKRLESAPRPTEDEPV